MSLFDCLEVAASAGEMDRSRAAQLQQLVRDLEAQYQHMGPEAAAAAAAEDAKRILRENVARKRRLTLKQIQTARRLTRDIEEHRDLRGELNAADALIGLVENNQANRFSSVSSVRQALRGRYHRMIDGFLRQHARDITGAVRNTARLPDIVRELFGEGTGDGAASEMAGAISTALEAARRDFNSAGGDIGRLEDFGLPHSHDRGRLTAAGRDAWIAEIMPALDWGRIVDHRTGEAFGGGLEGRKVEFLAEIFEAIRTDGRSREEPSFGQRGRSLANRRADHRVLHFRSADAWLAYNEQFGRGNAFEVVVNHLDMLARDTAMMRVLGPNPRAGLEFAVQTAEKLADNRPWKNAGLSTLLEHQGQQKAPSSHSDAPDRALRAQSVPHTP